MSLTREQLREQVLRGEIHPVYVLYGPETYLSDLAAKTIANTCFGEGDFRDFNDDSFSLNIPDNIRNAISAANQLPMMAKLRVVRISEVKVSTSANKDTLKEDYFDAVAEYLKSPSPSSVVIFVADELNANRKVGKLLKAHAEAVEFARLGDAELVKWAGQELKKRDAEMDDRTLRHLLAPIWPDVRRRTVEIQKLAPSALPGKTIDADLVDSLVANVREIPNFDLTDNLVGGNRKKAVQILSKILDDGAEPIALIGLLSYNFRRLLIAKDLMERGADRSALMKAAKLYGNPEPFLSTARRADLTKLKHAIIRLAEADLAIKTSVGGSGPKGSRLQLEMLVCELVS